MPNTPNRGYPYPDTNDAARVPRDLGDIANQVDADVQGLMDEVETKLTGVGVSRLRALTQGEYDQLTPDPRTVYIIVDLEGGGPAPNQQQLGTPVTTSLTTTTASSITPNLPSVPTGWWGYLAVIMTNGWESEAWNAPTGWTRFYDNEIATGSRAVGVFSAPAGTPTRAFQDPEGTALRYVAMVFPVRRQPVMSGNSFGGSTPYDTVTAPQLLLVPPGIALTLIQTNYSSAQGSNLPNASGTSYGAGSGPAVVNGSGALTMMYADVGSYGDVAVLKQYNMSPAPPGEPFFYRIGVS